MAFGGGGVFSLSTGKEAGVNESHQPQSGSLTHVDSDLERIWRREGKGRGKLSWKERVWKGRLPGEKRWSPLTLPGRQEFQFPGPHTLQLV